MMENDPYQNDKDDEYSAKLYEKGAPAQPPPRTSVGRFFGNGGRYVCDGGNDGGHEGENY
jgi:hypothetical protein